MGENYTARVIAIAFPLKRLSYSSWPDLWHKRLLLDDECIAVTNIDPVISPVSLSVVSSSPYPSQ